MAATYCANFFPANAFTATTSAAVTGGQLVYTSGNNTVAQTTAATGAWLGVAATDADSGTNVTVLTKGIHTLAASGTTNAATVSSPQPPALAIGAGTDYSQVVGVAPAAASGGKVTVLRHYSRWPSTVRLAQFLSG